MTAVPLEFGVLVVMVALLAKSNLFADILPGEPTPETGDRYGEGRDPKYGL